MKITKKQLIKFIKEQKIIQEQEYLPEGEILLNLEYSIEHLKKLPNKFANILRLANKLDIELKRPKPDYESKFDVDSKIIKVVSSDISKVDNNIKNIIKTIDSLINDLKEDWKKKNPPYPRKGVI